MKGSKTSTKKQKGKKKEVDLSMASIGHPEIFPLLLTAKTQEIFNCRPDEDVTEKDCFKCIRKEDIIQDVKTRAKASDFHRLKKVILEYPGEELLVVFDPDFQYGQNFYMVASEEAKENFLKSLVTEEETEETEGENKEETLEVHKPWVSLGSEKEVEEESVKERDTKIKYKVSRVRRMFGAPITFTDKNASDDKEMYAECTAYEDDTFSIKMLERDVGVQMVPKLREASTQTKWTYPKNASTQYCTRQLSNEAKAESLSSEKLKQFLTAVHIRVEIALQQNEIMNVFFDDWKALAEDQEEGQPDVYLKAYQSFTDVQYLKNRTISCIRWHPTIYGIIALSAREQPSYEEQVNLSNKSLPHQSAILILSFFDPICLQLVLKAPEDIYCFQFSPSNPNIIAGGCVDGQVVLWDISKHEGKLQSAKPVADEIIESSEDEPRVAAARVTELSPRHVQQSSTKPSLVRHCAASSIPYSHTKPATDVHWLPCNFEDSQKGGASENRDENNLQLVTCSPDCSILFWDIPSIEQREKFLSEKIKEEKRSHVPHDVPDSDEDLDLSWKPLIKINLRERDNNTEYGPIRMSLRELEYHYKPPGKAKSLRSLRAPIKQKPYTEMSASSSKNLAVLQNISTDFFVGNEDGEIVYYDWKMKTDINSTKPVSQKHSQKYALHTETINTLQKSPFFKDIFLSIGGQKFAIWKEGVTNGPILQSSCSAGRYTAGQWSLTRPGVFFIGRDNGNIDIWDLLKKTHEPSYFQNISKSIITFISPSSASAEQHFLAVSDNLGVLHILEICQILCHPSSDEHANVLDYFEREVRYLKYCEEEFKGYQKFQAKTELKCDWRQRKHV
ncbi:WD repeat-containing protein 63 isoform X1 [Cyanistes caeruleus]|uniref:WD repeat-containing protein 63 n=2 Tax=Cyanistes caeruleus TaxID=156563 RepID=A0A8C0UBE0_CYACU|nr:WD repeat-containing protein 63 isoform X1 [Cyanistes caeruleus]XP_023787919.1 WD repeat-containing protein 63 isoform X1 [Cyanistes caeruleus]